MAGQAGASRAGGQLLLLARAATFAVVAVGLAGTAHTLAGGAAPTPLVCVLSVVALTQLTMLLGPRERGWLPIAATLLLSQLVLHPVLMAFPAHPHSEAAHLRLVAGGAGQMEWAHVAAALATAWWLRRGEARAAQLASGTFAAASRPLTAALALSVGASVPAPLRAVVRAVGDGFVLLPGDPGRSARRRGPPSVPVASAG